MSPFEVVQTIQSAGVGVVGFHILISIYHIGLAYSAFDQVLVTRLSIKNVYNTLDFVTRSSAKYVKIDSYLLL